MNIPLLLLPQTESGKKKKNKINFLFLLIWYHNVLWILFCPSFQKKKNLSLFFYVLYHKQTRIVVTITENTLAAAVPTRKISCCFYCCCRVSCPCLFELLFFLLLSSLSLSLYLSTTERHRAQTHIQIYTYTHAHKPRCWPRETRTTNNFHIEPVVQVDNNNKINTSGNLGQIQFHSYHHGKYS
jgi:hypothetical protein